jgi:hypothetical protein
MVEAHQSLTKADLGILVVHGIGQQQSAGPLLDYAEPLVSWTDAWSKARGGSGAQVVESWLSADGKPPRVRVVIDVVPLEYSIEWLTCAVASRLDAVMVG